MMDVDTLAILIFVLGFGAGYAVCRLRMRETRRRLSEANVVLQAHGYFLDRA